jgi:hypothetical protein
MSNRQETLLSVNEFKKPSVVDGKEAISTLLVRLIRLEPGTIPSRPKMGVGLYTNYKYCDEAKALQLQDHIKDQIKTYLPEFQGVQVKTFLNQKKELRIDITIDGVLYRYETVLSQDNRLIGINSIQ